jgi:hypothetical protein
MAEQDFASFDPKEYTCAVAGQPVDGFMPGTGIEIEWLTDAFEDVAGMTGLVSRGRKHDRRANLTLTLQHTSQWNVILSGLHNADINARNGAGIITFFLRDKQGSTVVEAARCWVVKFPNVQVSDAVTPRVWVLRLAKANAVSVGGN